MSNQPSPPDDLDRRLEAMDTLEAGRADLLTYARRKRARIALAVGIGAWMAFEWLGWLGILLVAIPVGTGLLAFFHVIRVGADELQRQADASLESNADPPSGGAA